MKENEFDIRLQNELRLLEKIFVKWTDIETKNKENYNDLRQKQIEYVKIINNICKVNSNIYTNIKIYKDNCLGFNKNGIGIKYKSYQCYSNLYSIKPYDLKYLVAEAENIYNYLINNTALKYKKLAEKFKYVKESLDILKPMFNNSNDGDESGIININEETFLNKRSFYTDNLVSEENSLYSYLKNKHEIMTKLEELEKNDNVYEEQHNLMNKAMEKLSLFIMLDKMKR